jgi:DNA repair protein RadC
MHTKLEKYGVESLQDYEIVEMLLFLAFKMKDTKTLAKILIKKFGTLNEVLHAKKEDILAINGLGVNTYNAFKIVDATVKAVLKDKIMKKNAVECFEDVISYCKINMKQLTIEELRIIYLNGAGVIIGDEVIQKGTIDTVELYAREILKQCIKIGAKGIILVHNHPSNDPTPSANDIICTKKMKEVCEIFNIDLLDHVIISSDKYIYFKNLLILQ